MSTYDKSSDKSSDSLKTVKKSSEKSVNFQTLLGSPSLLFSPTAVSASPPPSGKKKQSPWTPFKHNIHDDWEDDSDISRSTIKMEETPEKEELNVNNKSIHNIEIFPESPKPQDEKEKEEEEEEEPTQQPKTRWGRFKDFIRITYKDIAEYIGSILKPQIQN